MFRGERPQKGRLRQFHQVGIEWLGAPDPAADAECIIMLMEFYKRLGFDLSKLRLLINSMGDAQCRPAYREQVKQFILDHADEMCDECRERAELNPLRAFDCKNDHCREIMAEAPLMGDNLCDECREHYEQVKRYLDAAGIEAAGSNIELLEAQIREFSPKLAAVWMKKSSGAQKQVRDLDVRVFSGMDGLLAVAAEEIPKNVEHRHEQHDENRVE